MADNIKSRETLSKQIRALLAKTVENGCSEAEAMAAAELVGKLMAQYNISMTEVEVANEEYDEVEMESGAKKKTAMIHVVSAIGDFTDTKRWLKEDKGYTRKGRVATTNRVYVFWGTKKDIEIARYLYDLIKEAIRAGYRNYMNERTENGEENGAQVKKSFQTAMAIRIAKRLRQMKKDQMAQASTETGIVPIDKLSVIEKKYAEMHQDEEFKPVTVNTGDGLLADAYMAGLDAGDKVSIVPGINGANNNEKVLLLKAG